MAAPPGQRRSFPWGRHASILWALPLDRPCITSHSTRTPKCFRARRALASCAPVNFDVRWLDCVTHSDFPRSPDWHFFKSRAHFRSKAIVHHGFNREFPSTNGWLPQTRPGRFFAPHTKARRPTTLRPLAATYRANSMTNAALCCVTRAADSLEATAGARRLRFQQARPRCGAIDGQAGQVRDLALND